MGPHLVLASVIGLAAVAPLTPNPTRGESEARGEDRLALRLNYDGRVIVKVLTIDIDQRVGERGYSSSARLKSYGLLSLFRKVDNHSSAEGRISGGRALPWMFRSHNIDGRSNRRVTVTWSGADVVTEAQPPYNGRLGDPPASRAQRLEATDPLTAMIRIALSDDEAQLCRGTVRFFDGKQRYDVDFLNRTTAPASAREKRLGLAHPVHCQLRFREVAGFGKKPPAEQNQGLEHPVTAGFAQLGGDGPWVISFMESDTPLGRAHVELQRVEPLR